jgi:hypothetical protein
MFNNAIFIQKNTARAQTSEQQEKTIIEIEPPLPTIHEDKDQDYQCHFVNIRACNKSISNTLR